MLRLQTCTRQSRPTRHSAAYSSLSIRPLPVLRDGSLSVFRNDAFQPALPTLMPRGHFNELPAIAKWFGTPPGDDSPPSLNTEYLDRFKDAVVPLEITSNGEFAQVHERLSFFIEAASQMSTARIYLAQASLSDLPSELRNDVPTPEVVLQSGKGDIYDTSIWLGAAPTYTPLHRDPNPNLFVQLAGRKQVRLFRPEVGHGIFAHVQQTIGGDANAIMRGPEMMEGKEREVLEDIVWNDKLDAPWHTEGLGCTVDAGDGLFIPKGWWHSIKGIGHGMTGSVNWWFR